MIEELSPAEQRLASELANLVTDPDRESRTAIMRAVMLATLPEASTHRLWGRWQLLAATAATVALLAASTVGAFAASTNALPSSPTYQLRLAGEDIRLTLAGPKDRVQLRIHFAGERFRQAKAIAHNDLADARLLLQDGRHYLTQARDDVQTLAPNERGQIQNQLNQAQDEAGNVQSEVDQPAQPEPTPSAQPDQNSSQQSPSAPPDQNSSQQGHSPQPDPGNQGSSRKSSSPEPQNS